MTDDAMVKVINTLMVRRMTRGLSQRDLARVMDGFTVQSSISSWETGRCAPRLESLRRWADILGYDVHIELRERS